MAGLGAAEDQRMNVVRTFIGIHGLQVLGVAHDAISDLDAVATMHVARHASDVERLATVVALDDRDHLRRPVAGLHQATYLKSSLQAERDFRLHIGQLALIELGGGQRTVELLAVEAILTRLEPAVLGSTHRAPGDAIAGTVEAFERSA